MSVKYLGIPALVIAVAITFACTKITPFGSELLQDQSAILAASDTLTLRTTVVREENAVTADRQSSIVYLYCGQLNDLAETGRNSAELFTLFRPFFPTSGFVASDLRDATVDSVVMALRFAGAGFYGDTTQAQTVRVFRLETGLVNSVSYRANSNLQSGAELGSATIIPRPFTALRHPFDTALTAVKAPHFRMRLDPAFGRELIGYDSTIYVDTVFRERIRGLRITSTSNSRPGAIMAFNLAEQDNVSAINVYYTRRRDGAKLRQVFVFRGNNKFNRFVHDYSGSEAGAVLNRPNPSRLYAKGLSGLRIKVQVPYIKNLGNNVAINKAELVLTVASEANDPLAPAPQLAVSYRPLLTTDTTTVFIDDLFYSLGSTGTGGFKDFGGFPVTETVSGTTVRRYRINVTQHLQYLLQSKRNIPNEFYINVIGNGSVFTSPARSIFHGPGNTTFRPRLSLKYTRIK